MLCLVGVMVISLNPRGVRAAEFFVATTGNDSNSGTIGSPFLTLEKAANVMASGDTMFIRGGTYRRTAQYLDVPSGGGSWATATTVQAYKNEEVIITPQDPTEKGTDVILLPNNKSYIIFDGLILDGLRSGLRNGGDGGFYFDRAYDYSNPSHHIRLINLEIRNTYSNAILTRNATHNEFINLNLHHADHNNPAYGYSQGPYGIYMASGNNLMMGCDVHHNGAYGIHHYSNHPPPHVPDNNIYIGNTVHDNGRSGFRIGGKNTNVTLINNLAYRNGWGPKVNRYGFHVEGGISNVLLYNNTSYGNVEGELLLRVGTLPVTIKNNIFFGVSDNAFTVFLDGSSGAVLDYNAIYHPHESFRIRNQGSATISNTIYKDPLFVNAKNADFHLQPGSPAIGKGVVLNEVKIDYDNVQRNLEGPFDIGAYSFSGSSLPSVSERPASPRNVQVY
ncbi:MAG TPA: right-handed parallel beta-helix repeat-containing protein [Nitrospirales bacterium]|nr:right-handed parallel beta-helix repeat-containing protein [Nitrospirales bacterium]